MKRAINWILNRRIIKPVVIACMNDKQKERYYILQLRAHMAFFGHDVSDMTDDEIKDGYDRVRQLMHATGLTANEAGQALRGLSEAFKNETP